MVNECLETGDFLLMEKKSTIQDIAAMAGVSKSTVSRYLNNGYVSREKAAKISEIIDQTGFQSNFFAKRLKTKHSKLIGVVLPRMDSVTVGKLLAGINHILAPAGWQAILLVSDLDQQKEIKNIISLQQQGVDGIIVDSIAITDGHLDLLRSLDLPVVFTGQQHPAVHYVKINDELAGRMMGEYLRQKGHRRVVFAGVTEADCAVGRERRLGFVEAFAKGNPAAEVFFVETGFSFAGAYDKGAEIVAFGPTAVVCATDNIGLGLLRYLHELGVRVPADISLAGFGGYEVGAVSYPALTTIAFNYEMIGMKTAQGMLDLLDGQEMTSNNDLPLVFIERESVRALEGD